MLLFDVLPETRSLLPTQRTLLLHTLAHVVWVLVDVLVDGNAVDVAEVEAESDGMKATLTIDVATEPPPPDGLLTIDREPPGRGESAQLAGSRHVLL